MDVRIVDPAGSEPPTRTQAVAARPTSLAGARIAVLSNGKPNAGYVVATLGRSLAERLGAAAPAMAEKPNSSVTVTGEVLDEFRNFDAAIVGVGD
jgi:hypothetical protein